MLDTLIPTDIAPTEDPAVFTQYAFTPSEMAPAVTEVVEAPVVLIRYALVQNGIVENVVDAAEPPADWVECNDAGPGWGYNGSKFTPPAQVVAARNITVSAFKSRLTAAERKAIRVLAKSNADIEDYTDMLDSARQVDLDNARTRGGLQALESLGVLAAGRALIILDADIQLEERP